MASEQGWLNDGLEEEIILEEEGWIYASIPATVEWPLLYSWEKQKHRPRRDGNILKKNKDRK